nr:hypothetical protein [Clostridium beijerinckii]
MNHDNDYKGTAEKYYVSYSQVYLWVKRCNNDDEEGLTDKRVHHNGNEEVDELEILRRENKRLKRQIEGIRKEEILARAKLEPKYLII